MPAQSELAKALTAFHADLPHVGKGSTNPAFRSKYANLSDIVSVVLPALAKQGLAWFTLPTVTEDGFFLNYELRHTSGESITGSWPLPDPEKANPQQMGSAVTYGKRYALSAVTGIAPDEDDDGNAASAGPASAPRRNPAPFAKQAPREPAHGRIEAAKEALRACTDDTGLRATWDKVHLSGLAGIPELVTVHAERQTALAHTAVPVDEWATVEVPK